MLHESQCTGSMTAPATFEKEEDPMAEKKEAVKIENTEEAEVKLTTEEKKAKKEDKKEKKGKKEKAKKKEKARKKAKKKGKKGGKKK